MSHFKLISSTKASDVIPANKYVSDKTGLTVIIAETEGPLVNGLICLATEAEDDDGLPHTLEHLIFLGSERYPYKGILDLLANRGMGHDTSAWTNVDHTCYTIYTAGDAGMLTLLPIYLDHILNPTLTDQGFITEVHHVNGDGEDAGVVYCQMQGRENTADNRCELRLLRAMYPNSGYSMETGGIMENLRVSTDNIKVRNFHKKFYRSENLTIILTGQFVANDVFAALATVEDDIIAKREKEPLQEWVKPWQTIPPPPQCGEFKEQWPADTEDCGQVLFGWRGPLLTDATAMKDLTACDVLLQYLCDTAAAPLQRCLVEREDALVGDIYYNLTTYIASLIKIELYNVPINKLEAARDETKKCLESVRSGETPIDMERMRRLVKKLLKEELDGLELDPHHTVTFRCLRDALYSQNEEDFVARMNPQHLLQQLQDESEEYWLGLLRNYWSDQQVVIVGAPSIEFQAKMAEEEKSRLEAQRALLGESGLVEKFKQLEEATEFNARPPPPGTLASVPVPACDRLKYHRIATWSSDGSPCPHLPLEQLPLYTRAHSLHTNLVYINLVLDMTATEQKPRKWLPLFLNALGECPVRRGDALIPHEEVISAMEQKTVVCNKTIGFGSRGNFSVGTFGNFVLTAVRCEPQDYEDVVNLLYEILYCAEISKERLLVFAQRLIDDVAQVRRDDNKMVYDALRDSLYSKDSNMHWCTVLRQHKFLKELVEQLNAGGDSAEAALSEAREMFRAITAKPWLHIAADFDRHKLSVEPWKKFANGNDVVAKPPTLYMDEDLIAGRGGGFVAGVGGLESSFLVQFSPGVSGYCPAATAPLTVALDYFMDLKGPMWQLIRGSGLSLVYDIRAAHNEGRLAFSLYRATNAPLAYTKTKAIVHAFCNGAGGVGEFDEDLFASVKSSTVFEVVEEEKCPVDVVTQSLYNYVRQQGTCYNSELVSATACVSSSSAAEAARKWLSMLIDPEVSKMAVVCHPTKVKDMQTAFEKIGVKLEAFESIELSPFNN